jgi:hypothetical protein
MKMLRSIDQRLNRLEDRVVHHDEAIEELQAWVFRPSPGLAESQTPPLITPQFEATSVPPPVPVTVRDREPTQR